MSLVDDLVQQLGVSADQAEGGTGLMMKLAKEKLSSGDFSQISELIPGLDGMLGKAPDLEAPSSEAGEQGGMLKALGGITKQLGLGDIGEKLGDLAKVAKGFESLGLDTAMISKFATAILAYLKSQGGEQVAAILKNVLK
ncbi:hypothetical protein Pla175_02380 [Pirellulimonas nuda]|uniref:DUF2780 domain-containing protein n=2 Tax=Pirellulimonas nuda TaxID=2528009 RepID=A0A518D5Y6_9BACT|nr:hypothetical protein Pla175_02380 [Pirellulimonas nuda]